VRWQLSQEAVVGTCVAGLLTAFVPLWQDTQVPGTTPEWLKPVLTSIQLAAPIRWQLSHEEGVDMCPDGFPRA
jgi:hypothetical protein